MSPRAAAIRILWALPWTLFGLAIGLLGLATGGRCRRIGRTLEFWGGLTTAFLRHFPLAKGVSAVTFGHTILGCGPEELDRVRPHEMVHVRQYERWGPMLVPAYLFHWVWLSILRRDPYRENPFERQAFEEESE